MILNQKETTLLQDIKAQEQLCIDKYNRCATEAQDPKLKQLFKSIESAERKHLDSISKLLNGTIPQSSSSMHSSEAPESSAAAIQLNYNSSATYDSLTNDHDKTNDKFLCSDTLASEKHVSSVYNTDIFEFRDEKIRNILNHIQAEEQHHGKQLYDYMSQNGMYQA